jgi:hypothetical protein
MASHFFPLADQPAKVKKLKALRDKWSAEQAAPCTPDSPAGKAKKNNEKKNSAK